LSARVAAQPVGPRAQRGDGEGHGDAVIAEGIEFGAVEGLASGNLEAVFEFFHLRAHEAQVGGHGGDAVGFFHTQFAGVAHFDSLRGEGSDGCKHWNLINQGGGVSVGDGCAF